MIMSEHYLLTSFDLRANLAAICLFFAPQGSYGYLTTQENRHLAHDIYSRFLKEVSK